MSLYAMALGADEDAWTCHECGKPGHDERPACEHKDICGDCYPGDCWWCIRAVEDDIEAEAAEGRLRARDYERWASL